jgi:hypothetical protein
MKLSEADSEMVAHAAMLHEVSGMSPETASEVAHSTFADKGITLTAPEVEKKVREAIRGNEAFLVYAETATVTELELKFA